ncbi:MAG: anti-sigma factor [Pseudomonadales bacterium]
MHCEHVQSLLFEYADGLLAQDTRGEVSEHLTTCPHCSADHASILEMESQARVWHDLPAPAWQIPKIPSRVNFSQFTQWFPSLASAAALILVGVLYFKDPGSEPKLGLPPTSAPPNSELVSLQNLDQRNLMQTALDTNRAQRQQELEVLVRLLKGEMDRRSLETEESLRYVIAHQIQGQRELDDLYERVQKISYPEPLPRQIQ